MEIFKELISQNPIGILIWSQAGLVKYTNQCLLRLLNYKTFPSNLKDCASEESSQNELNLLKSLENSNKKYRTYTKEFLSENKETIKLDVMTSLVSFKEDTYY